MGVDQERLVGVYSRILDIQVGSLMTNSPPPRLQPLLAVSVIWFSALGIENLGCTEGIFWERDLQLA